MKELILAINPGSTSTKIGVFRGRERVLEEVLRHGEKELVPFRTIADQYSFRKGLILQLMQDRGLALADLRAVVGRGGLLRPVQGGTYTINAAMREDLQQEVGGPHACNLGALIAYEIAQSQRIPSFIVDPPVVDEMQEIARLSGLPELARASHFHTLNHRMAARKAAARLGSGYCGCNLVIAHMGGGISVVAHAHGRAIDTNDGVDSEGSYTPERAGTLPVAALMALCFSGRYTQEEMRKRTVGQGGLKAYLCTNDAREIVARIRTGDARVKLVYEGMGYQVAKEIGAYATVLKGEVDAICLTGGLAYDSYLTDYITDMVRYIAPVFIFPGEDELLALAEGALRVLEGEEEAQVYAPDIKGGSGYAQ